MVVLSGLEFLFRFLPVFLIIYFLVPSRFRGVVLFAGSLYFYAAGGLDSVPVLLALTVFNYAIGCGMRKSRGLRSGRLMFIVGIWADVLFLLYCKMSGSFLASPFFPLGISFFTFKMISYLADLYTGRIEEMPTFLNTAVYFTMFPQVTQGPIMRYAEGGFIDSGTDRNSLKRPTAEHFEEGIVYCIIGLSLKVLLADRISLFWNELEKIGFESISTPLAWLGAYGYTFRLYYDFWGYSLIAAGVGMMLGFPFIKNFDHPYASSSISEFYRRWHSSLGTFFRDYIYIPLGGSRKGTGRTCLNLFAVWMITGFWHGVTANFLIWGGVLGVLIILEKLMSGTAPGLLKITGRIGVLVLIPLTWVVFAVSDLGELAVYFGKLFPVNGLTGTNADLVRLLPLYLPYFAAGGILLVPGIYKAVVKHRRNPIVIIMLMILLWTSLYYDSVSSLNPFLYFSF